VGVAIITDYRDEVSAEELLRRADMAMYLAKRKGKGRVVIFDDDAREPILVAGTAQRAAVLESAAAG